jgi:hypothetical protein
MMKCLLLLLLTTQAFGYVPTVESLLRHGSNPDVTANGISLTLSVKKLNPGLTTTQQDPAQIKEKHTADFFKLFFTKNSDLAFKLAQTQYENASFSEASLVSKVYYPNFTPYTLKASGEEVEKGLFFGLLESIVYNNGAFLINYLKNVGVPVKLNSEIINREKVELLADYKRYLTLINKDRNARKTEVSPLRPDEPAARERAHRIMDEPMYIDTGHVQLSREDGQMAWLVKAGDFEAVVSYRERDIQKIRYKSPLGEFEVTCKEYWLGNGTHRIPRLMMVRDFRGEIYQIEVTNMRHYNEREGDLIKRLQNWDKILKGKNSTDPKPSFLL